MMYRFDSVDKHPVQLAGGPQPHITVDTEQIPFLSTTVYILAKCPT